jgi:choline-sulfatase
MSDFNDDHRDLRRVYEGSGYSEEEIEQARRLYEGEVRYADHEIGRLLGRLGELGLAANTLVVVASDHGESLGEHGLFFAHDYTLYDELTHVAQMVRGPGVAAGLHDAEVSLLDVAPTLCRLAALRCDENLDGRDLFASAPRTLFAATTPARSKGTPFARLELAGLGGRWTMALRDGRKLVRIPAAAAVGFEMYDLTHDPGERRDIASEAVPQQVALRAELDAWMKAMDDVRPAGALPERPRKRRADVKTLRGLGYLE